MEELNISFITVVKEKGNKYLFEYINDFDWGEDLKNRDVSQGEYSFLGDNSHINKFRFVNQVPLNDSHLDFKVNFLEYWEIDEKGKVLYHNTWVTDILITQENVYKIARVGRVLWHVENETFNTLKKPRLQL